MQSLNHKDKELLVKFDIDGLTPAQVRLIKNIHSLVAGVLTSEDEGEFFESSAELMKRSAELIKHANFALQHKQMSYGDQAVEFAVDSLNEAAEERKLQNIDN
jgi:hypothetical protein